MDKVERLIHELHDMITGALTLHSPESVLKLVEQVSAKTKEILEELKPNTESSDESEKEPEESKSKKSKSKE